MENPLLSRHGRRVFYVSAGLAFVALLVIRIFALPNFFQSVSPDLGGALAEICEEILSALTAAIAATTVILWLSPPAQATATMVVVESYKIREALEEAIRETDEWWYRGHSGRHFRAVTLPRLAADAKAASVSKRIFLQILDPTSADCCRYYAEYRQRLRTARDQPWTPQLVRQELFATIISAYAWRAAQPSLDVTVALMTVVSLFRVDLSSRLALITKEDPQEPALRCDAGTIFYRSYREDLRLTLAQARCLPAVTLVPIPQLTGLTTKAALDQLGIGAAVSNADAEEISRLVKLAANPYA